MDLKLEWYVMNINWNNKEVEYINIFNTGFNQDVEKAIKNYVTYNLFKEEIRRSLMYHYWSKAEWEMIIYDLAEKGQGQKIDVYFQLIPNLDNICKYIIDKYNNRKYGRRKLKI